MKRSLVETVPSVAKFLSEREQQPRDLRTPGNAFEFGNPQTGGDCPRHPLQQTDLPPPWL